MPISTAKLVYDFRRKYNALNTGKNRELDLVDIIALLNEGQERWYKNQLRLEQTNQEIRNNLRPYLESKIEVACTSVDSNCCLLTYPDDLYKRKNQLAIANKDCCPGLDKEIIIRIVQSDDLHEARHNPLRRSDFFFEQLIGVEDKLGLLVYHDNQMDVIKGFIDYYRRPRQLHAPSLVECDGPFYYDYDGIIVTKDQPFEGDSTYSANDVVDLAVLFAQRDTMDYDGYQTQYNKILQAPTLGIDR